MRNEYTSNKHGTLHKKSIVSNIYVVFYKYLYSSYVLLYYNMKDIISIKGERNLWIDFIAKVKKEKKEVWEVLEPIIKKYLKEKWVAK